MGSRSIEIVSDSMFNTSYTIEDIEFKHSKWNDFLGSKLTSKTKKIPSDINYKQNSVIEKTDYLAKLDVNEIKYESQKYTISELEIHE